MNKPEPEEFAPLYTDWKDIYNWTTCKTGRQNYGEFLSAFVRSQTDKGCVINLNGAWGTGKTELLRRLYVDIVEHGHPVAYIDAWSSDFSKNALSVVASELLNQIGHFITSNEGIDSAQVINKIKKHFDTALKAIEFGATVSMDLVTAALAKGGQGIVSKIPDAESKAINSVHETLIDTVSQNHAKQVQAMKEIKLELNELAKQLNDAARLNVPMVFLIDELDRCRPSYAIEMLEVIKHFFEADNCVFLVATDTGALECSIKSIYGADFLSNVYLQRFFDRKIVLPELDTTRFIENMDIDYSKYSGKIKFEELEIEGFDLNTSFAALFNDKAINPRGISKVIARYISCLDFISSESTKVARIDRHALMAGLIYHECGASYKALGTNYNNAGLKGDFNSLQDILEAGLNCAISSVRKHETHFNIMLHDIDIYPMLCMKVPGKKLFNGYRDVPEIQQYIASSRESKENSNVKYWVWSDYLSVIELSGNIEF